MMDPTDRAELERIQAGGLTGEERDLVYRAEHGLLTDEDRVQLRDEVTGFIYRNRWLIRRRTLAAWLWGADEGMPEAWRWGRWLIYVVIALTIVFLLRR